MNRKVTTFWIAESKHEPGKYISYLQYYQPIGYTNDILKALRYHSIDGLMGAIGGHYNGYSAKCITLTEQWEQIDIGEWPDPETVFYRD